MKTIQVQLYTAAELKSLFPKAFEATCEKYNDTMDGRWWDFCYDDLIRIAGLMGFDIDRENMQFSGFWSQGDGASFTGSAVFAADALEKVKADCPLDEELHRIAAECSRYGAANIRCNLIRTSRHYCHENTVSVTAWRDVSSESDVWVDNLPDDISEDDVQQTCRDLMEWHYRQLEKECEYRSGEECFLETCEANDWHFEADGTMNNDD